MSACSNVFLTPTCSCSTLRPTYPAMDEGERSAKAANQMGSKTRFVVGMDGGERELFSVEENARGGLTIILPVDPPQSVLHVCPIVHRFSVHESEQAEDGGFLIKESFKQSDGGYRSNYAYVRPCDGNALLPAFARLSASLRVAPDSARKPRKATVSIFADHSGGPVFFVVTVSRQPIERKYFPAGTSLKEHAFRKYYLYVTSGVFNGAAGNANATVTMMSSGPIQDGVRYERTADFDIPEPVSPSPSHLAWYIEQRIADLSAVLTDFAATAVWDDRQVTVVERLNCMNLAGSYTPASGSKITTLVGTRQRYWEANPPEGLFIHPKNAEITYKPAT